jgi:hypothetical protein
MFFQQQFGYKHNPWRRCHGEMNPFIFGHKKALIPPIKLRGDSDGTFGSQTV